MLNQWAEKRVLDEEKKRVFWWQSKYDPRPNIGDYVAYDLVQRMLAMKGKRIVDKRDAGKKLVSVGSVLHFARNGDALWGTGYNKKMGDSVIKFDTLDVRAVRGPLTRDYLLKRGIAVPEVYGDPALLLPYFYKKELLQKTDKKPFIIINHMNDDMAQYAGYEQHLVSPMQYPGSFIEAIVNSERVISSSLHGVIIAEAYGIPAVFYDSNSGESMFKYEDYYQGTGRQAIPRTDNIERGITMNLPTPPDFTHLTHELYHAFPFDLW